MATKKYFEITIIIYFFIELKNIKITIKMAKVTFRANGNCINELGATLKDDMTE